MSRGSDFTGELAVIEKAGCGAADQTICVCPMVIALAKLHVRNEQMTFSVNSFNMVIETRERHVTRGDS